MGIFFSADHHFGHSNIIKFEKRPFTDAKEMDEALIARWNERVGADDEVYYLGDISLHSPAVTAKIVEQLNGRIHLIRGNHDKDRNLKGINERFVWIKDYHFLTVPDDGPLIALMHYCLRIWDRKHYGSWHLFGHSHSRLPEIDGELALNVGVDCWDFYPVSLEEIQQRMESKIAVWKGSQGNAKFKGQECP